MTLYAFRDFNYYNRRAVTYKASTISEFIDTFGMYIYMQTDTYGNFAERDGVATKQILGTNENPYLGDASYLLVCDDNNTITSRWYIVDQDQKRYGQYELSLYRDVVDDYWDKIVDAPMFIEKANVRPDSPFIYNKENVFTNQIKQSETLLKDESEVAWLIGYLAKDYNSNEAIDFDVSLVPDASINTIVDIGTYIGATQGTTYRILKSSSYTFTLYSPFSANAYWAHHFAIDDSGVRLVESTQIAGTVDASKWYYTGDLNTRDFVDRVISIMSGKKPLIDQAITDTADFDYNTTKCEAILAAQNKILYIEAVDQYRKIVTKINNEDLDISYTYLQTVLSYNLSSLTHNGTTIDSAGVTNNDAYSYKAELVFNGSVRAVIGVKDLRVHCKDVFDLICIPYGDVIIKNSQMPDTWTDIKYTKDFALNVAQGLAEKLNAHLYDFQVLPYCPMTGLSYSNSTVDGVTYRVIDINTQDLTRFKLVYNYDGQIGDPVCALLFSASNKGSKDLAYSIPVTNKKMQNQTQLIRLCAPNYTAQFDFSAAKNNGVSLFNVDYNYLPYRPYIHVAPMWNVDGIYGGDYNDAKGLICGGDFSISYLSDQWVSYQVQNKNFQEVFDRGTQNLETKYDYERKQSIANTITGALGAGAGAGLLVGGPVGAAVGGIAGALSASAGAIDLQIQKELHNEAMDYRKDLFDMQLDNVKALPDTIAKVTAINENNKIFPFIEIYDCTEEERIAVANKIAWNGMTVGVIGRISDYLDIDWDYGNPGEAGYVRTKGYIKGQPIWLRDISDDTHLLNAIADELNKGVYTL